MSQAWVHGGKSGEIEKVNNQPWNTVLDFSSSVNPLGPPPKAVEAIKERGQDSVLSLIRLSTLLRETIAYRNSAQ